METSLNFGSFLIVCALRLSGNHGTIAVLALTSPPLISFPGGAVVQLKEGN